MGIKGYHKYCKNVVPNSHRTINILDELENYRRLIFKQIQNMFIDFQGRFFQRNWKGSHPRHKYEKYVVSRE
jgi:hypothetical protein